MAASRCLVGVRANSLSGGGWAAGAATAATAPVASAASAALGARGEGARPPTGEGDADARGDACAESSAAVA